MKIFHSISVSRQTAAQFNLLDTKLKLRRLPGAEWRSGGEAERVDARDESWLASITVRGRERWQGAQWVSECIGETISCSNESVIGSRWSESLLMSPGGAHGRHQNPSIAVPHFTSMAMPAFYYLSLFICFLVVVLG